MTALLRALLMSGAPETIRQGLLAISDGEYDELIDAVIPLVHHDDADVRADALDVLGTLGEINDPQYVPMIRTALADPDETVRSRAIDAAAMLELADLIEDIRPKLHDPDWIVRCSAAEAAGTLPDRAALPRLLEMAEEDPLPEVRAYAASAIGMLGDIAALERLNKMLDREMELGVRGQLLLSRYRLLPSERDLHAALELLSTLRDQAQVALLNDIWSLLSERPPKHLYLDVESIVRQLEEAPFEGRAAEARDEVLEAARQLMQGGR